MKLVMQEQVELRPYNTLGLSGRARWFAEVHADSQLLDAHQAALALEVPLLPLGGGSNLLLTGDVPVLVVRFCSRGIRRLQEKEGRVLVEAEAGESWQALVEQSLDWGLAGLENLSLIPGTVGAAPVQNIGAYGVELQDVVAGVTALDRNTGQFMTLQPADCQFAYRDSCFRQQPGRWLIARVRFWLCRDARSRLDYAPLRQYLQAAGLAQPTPRQVSEAVCTIRRSKLPDPALLGNAGSFFKNPVVSAAEARRLQQTCPDLVLYPQTDGQVKLAAGWLIEQAGWKGFREGDAGVHQQQALVLVNHGQATGAQMLALARRIADDVAERFQVQLEMEPVQV